MKYELEINNEKYVIIGTTLFSDIPNEKMHIVSNVNDFKHIYKKNNGKYCNITHEDYKNFYVTGKEFIENQLNFYRKLDFKIIVVTHHAPSSKCIDEKYIDSEIKCAFYSDLNYLINNIYCWIYGHTHSQKEIYINNVKVVTNAIGYVDEIVENVVLEKVI